jgi:L-fuculose-phosphate aldolase
MYEEIRQHTVWLAKEMLRRGLTDGTSGNVSVLDSTRQFIAITPSGEPYQTMTDAIIPVLDLDGKQVWGHLKPSSEKAMHLAAFHRCSNINTVLHTHSRYAIAMACAHTDLPAITVDMAAYCGKSAPVVPYILPGTQKLAEAIAGELAKGRRALLMANHGTLVVAPSPEIAIEAADALELAAMAYIRGCIVGKPVPIPAEDIEKLLAMIYGDNPGAV